MEISENSKQEFFEFIKIISENKKEFEIFSKSKKVEDSYKIVKKYCETITLEEYEELLLRCANKIKKKRKLSVSELSKISGGGKGSYISYEIFSEIANTIVDVGKLGMRGIDFFFGSH